MLTLSSTLKLGASSRVPFEVEVRPRNVYFLTDSKKKDGLARAPRREMRNTKSSRKLHEKLHETACKSSLLSLAERKEPAPRLIRWTTIPLWKRCFDLLINGSRSNDGCSNGCSNGCNNGKRTTAAAVQQQPTTITATGRTRTAYFVLYNVIVVCGFGYRTKWCYRTTAPIMCKRITIVVCLWGVCRRG